MQARTHKSTNKWVLARDVASGLVPYDTVRYDLNSLAEF